MAILKIIRDPYRNNSSVQNLIEYCLNPHKMPNNCYGAQGISFLNPYQCIDAIKTVFCHNYGKQMEHFVLSFDKSELHRLSISKILNLSYAICEYFSGRQILFALHERNDEAEANLHIHFVMNTTNVSTGHKDRLDFSNEYEFSHYVGALLSHFDITERLILTVS